MESLRELLTPSRFSSYSQIVACLYLLCGIVFSGIVGNLRASELRNFHCDVGSIDSDKNFLRGKCFDQYEQQYNSPLPLYGFTPLSFSVIVIVCIVYSWCCVKSRVDEVEHACQYDPENPRPTPRITTRRVFICYLTQLVVRLTLGILFTIMQTCVLYPSGFATEFLCDKKLQKSKVIDVNMTFINSSFINCQNFIGSDKDYWSTIIWIVNIIFACLVVGELIYLIRRTWKNKSFMFDSEFCQSYLFNKRKTQPRIDQHRDNLQRRIIEDTEILEPIIPPTPEENEGYKNLDDIYVDLIIHTGRSKHDFDMTRMKKHEIFSAYLEPPQDSIKINKLEELFLPNKDSDDPRKVLIYGFPGIGKSLLCKKLLHDWSKGKMLQESTSKFQYVFLLNFRSFNSEEMKSMSLQTLLSKSRYSEGKIEYVVFQSILERPDKVLLVFDGLDEFKDHQKCVEDERKHAGNGVAEIMPTSALYVKLVKGKILYGATVLTTTRPYAMDSVESLKFDRAVEIMGFSPIKVEEYCTKFFQHDSNAMDRIWQHIKSNVNLLYLCYIPVNCFIICSLLEKNNTLTDCHSGDVTLPTTLTEVYKGASKLFIFKHHPEYQGKPLKKRDLSSDGVFSSSVEETLLKLEPLAFKGIDERRLVFNSEEVQGMENCGLLNRMPDVEIAAFSNKPQYCFIHLTLQEFIAAKEVVKMDPKELMKFISSKAKDAKWHLVIQFVAGLLRGKDTIVKDIFVELLQHGLLSDDNVMALLMMKCLCELSDVSIAKKAAAELKSNSKFSNKIELLYLNLNPVDCTAIVYFVKHIDALECHNVSQSPLGSGGCSELAKLLEEGGPQILDIAHCEFYDKDLIPIFEAMKSKKCKLSHLILSHNHDLTDDSFSYLCDTLIDENCKLTDLELRDITAGNDGVLNLCIALKHKNCKLTKLRFALSEHMDERFYSNLRDALKDENCKLTKLDLENNSYTTEQDDTCILHVSQALKHENCKLTDLRFKQPVITDQGLSYFCEALIHENCKLTKLELVGSENRHFRVDAVDGLSITDKGISGLSDALTHQNCKLTTLSLRVPDPSAITNKGIKKLQNALTHKNCKLEELTLCRNAEEYCFSDLQRCKVRRLDSGHNVLTKRGVLGQYEEISLDTYQCGGTYHTNCFKIHISR